MEDDLRRARAGAEAYAAQLQDQAVELERRTKEARTLAEELEQTNEELLDATREAERARDTSAFLAEASRLLAASLDHAATLRTVAGAVVPRLGDRCAVDLGRDGALVAITTLPPVHERPAGDGGGSRQAAVAAGQGWRSPAACRNAAPPTAHRAPVALLGLRPVTSSGVARRAHMQARLSGATRRRPAEDDDDGRPLPPRVRAVPPPGVPGARPARADRAGARVRRATRADVLDACQCRGQPAADAEVEAAACIAACVPMWRAQLRWACWMLRVRVPEVWVEGHRI